MSEPNMNNHNVNPHPQATAQGQTHRIRPMSGRDPHEHGRTVTTLELLYDLVFVVAIGQAANQFAHLVSEGHFIAATAAFLFAMFAVMWTWVNFSWFSSAFDTDDWPQRLATMVQMVGVTVIGLGLPAEFRSIDSGESIDIRIVVAGYVVIRAAMVFQWLRAARQSPQYRATCLTYAYAIVIAQIGWVAVTWVHLAWTEALWAGVALLAFELAVPYLAETRHRSTPWHAHHIAERYGGLLIIALGEGVVGTVASLSAVVQEQGWTLDAALVAVAGMGLTFGMWWSYFLISTAEILHVRRQLAFKWAYCSMLLFAAIAATGAGLHVAALVIAHEAHISPVAAVLALTIPVAVYVIGLYVLYSVLYREVHRFHLVLLLVTALVLIAAPALAASGVSMTTCLLVVMIAPAVNVIGYEVYGYRHVAAALDRALGL